MFTRKIRTGLSGLALVLAMAIGSGAVNGAYAANKPAKGCTGMCPTTAAVKAQATVWAAGATNQALAANQGAYADEPAGASAIEEA